MSKDLYELKCGECGAVLATSDNPEILNGYLACTPCDEEIQSAAVLVALSTLPGNANELTKLEKMLEAAELSRQGTLERQTIQISEPE
jgi:hypothetical protein